MTEPSPRRRMKRAWLGLLIVLAFGCTAFGIALIALADSTRNMRIGFVAALWGALLWAFALHGTRWTQAAPRVEPDGEPGRELTLRDAGEIELERDASARRAYEMQLEIMLRRQMEQVLREQVAALRQDIAGLRGEVLEAVDGRLRLERIETTRIIGSDLAALQNEVRRLNVEREAIPAVAAREILPRLERPAPAAEPIQVSAGWTPAGARPAGTAHSELWTPMSVQGVPASAAAAASAPAAPSPVARSVPPAPSAQPATASPTAASPAAASPAAASPAAASPAAAPAAASPAAASPAAASPVAAPPVEPLLGSDPFAGLPRLSSFDAEALRPPPTTSAAPQPPAPVASAAPAAPVTARRAHPNPPAPSAAPSVPGENGEYVGRRRRAAAAAAAAAEQAAGSHS